VAGSIMRKLIKAAMPYGLIGAAKSFSLWLQKRKVIHPENISLKNKHDGERCFILCNGPSINTQNLLPLKSEIVFSVSNGYRHPDFLTFQPTYHCIPQVTRTRLRENEISKWFQEMDSALGSAEIFMSDTEKELVKKNTLFHGRKIHYLALGSYLGKWNREEVPDLSKACMGVQSVPIMCLMIAMYMGFKKIYLLGVDHDHFLKGEYKYFYKRHSEVLRGKLGGVSDEDKITDSRYVQFCELKLLWEQYRVVKAIALANGIKVFNATAGGALDEFPRVRLEDVIDVKGV